MVDQADLFKRAQNLLGSDECAMMGFQYCVDEFMTALNIPKDQETLATVRAFAMAMFCLGHEMQSGDWQKNHHPDCPKHQKPQTVF